mmetsp:Transcript_114837/g.319854  ORF Transcript_114837/g.319854 Transcript_114837/m.319854 type:complete len:86 (-) Transcript_114837:68-325(-)
MGCHGSIAYMPRDEEDVECHCPVKAYMSGDEQAYMPGYMEACAYKGPAHHPGKADQNSTQMCAGNDNCTKVLPKPSRVVLGRISE